MNTEYLILSFFVDVRKNDRGYILPPARDRVRRIIRERSQFKWTGGADFVPFLSLVKEWVLGDG